MRFKTTHRQKEPDFAERMYIEIGNGEQLHVEDRNGEIVIRCSNDDHVMVIQPTASNQFTLRFIPRNYSPAPADTH